VVIFLRGRGEDLDAGTNREKYWCRHSPCSGELPLAAHRDKDHSVWAGSAPARAVEVAAYMDSHWL